MIALIIILLVLIVIGLIFFLLKPQRETYNPQWVNAQLYNKVDNTQYYFPEEYKTNKPLFTLPQDNRNPTLGIAFSGGGARAS